MKKGRKRAWRSVIAMIMVLSLVLGTASTVFAAVGTDVNEDGQINYVSLGASQTNGYGMRGYLDDEVYQDPATFDKNTANVFGYQRAPEGAYPYMLSKEIEKETGMDVHLDQLAMSSMRAEEVHMLLDDSYNGDDYTEWRFSAGHNWFERAGGLDNLRDEYQSAVAGADVITVELGVNNFGVYAINEITSGGEMFDCELSDILTEKELSTYSSIKPKIRDMIVAELGYSEDNPIDLIADTFPYAYVGFIRNFDEVIKHIRELNPDAQIVVLNIPNMMEGVEAEVPGLEGTIPLGEAFGAVIDMANIYTQNRSEYNAEYLYADAGNTETFLDQIIEYDGNPETLGINMKDCFDVYDDDLRIRPRIQELYGGTDKYETALNAAYDIVATIMQEGAKQNTVDFQAMMSDGLGDAKDKVMKYIESSISSAVIKVALGQEYEFDFDETLLEDPAVRTVLSMGVRTSIGNSFFAHPSENGHAEVMEAVLSAMESEKTAADITDEKAAALVSCEYMITEDSYYVALGDSTVSVKDAGENNYAAQVAQELGLYDSQYANLGYTLKAGEIGTEKLLTTIEENTSEIEKADLITLGIGNAQFIEFMAGQLGRNPVEMDWSKYVDEKGAAVVEETLADMEADMLAEGMSQTIVDTMMKAMESYAYAYVAFLSNYPEAVSKIHEINPDAQVIVVGMYNPLDGVIVDFEGTEVPVGEYIDYIVKASNLCYTGTAATDEKVIYVEIPETETSMTAETYTYVEFLVAITRNKADMYPTEAGHEYIKNQILGAITVVEPPAFIYGDANGDEKINVKDAVLVLQYANKKLAADKLNLDASDVNGDGKVNVKDAVMILQYANKKIDSFPAGQ